MTRTAIAAALIAAVCVPSLRAGADETTSAAPSRPPVVDGYYARRADARAELAKRTSVGMVSDVSHTSASMPQPFSGDAFSEMNGPTGPGMAPMPPMAPGAIMPPYAPMMPASFQGGEVAPSNVPVIPQVVPEGQNPWVPDGYPTHWGYETAIIPTGANVGCDGEGECATGDEACLTGTCGTCGPCRPCFRVWANFDYMGLWFKGDKLPPLVTTSPPGTLQDDAGVLGVPGTTILYGNERVDTDLRSGGRVRLGWWWLGDNRTPIAAIEGHYWGVPDVDSDFHAEGTFSNGGTGPILARPFYNADLNLEDSLVLAFPDFNVLGFPVDLNGWVNVHTSSNAQSAGLGARVPIDVRPNFRLSALGGYRFFRLDEWLIVTSQINPRGFPFLQGSFIQDVDSFGTTNQFHGGEIGLATDWISGPWNLITEGRVAFGNMHEVVTIEGTTTVNEGGGQESVTTQGGLLTQPSNLGRHRGNHFSVLPSVDVTLKYQWHPRLLTTVGYNFQYITEVFRPGNEVDLIISPSQDEDYPRPILDPTSLWIQGFTGGLEFRY